MNDESELLRRYSTEGAEAAFAEIVRRHIGLVYHAALRQTGDPSLAEEVTQTVFTDLARKAGPLAGRTSIAGWLFTSTRFAATKARRGEQRRRAREQEVFAMQTTATDGAVDLVTTADWEQLRPVIDEVLHVLDARDREAVLLRFFEGRPLAEVGAKLAMSEDTARKRVARALDKLQGLLARRGITSTTAALGVAMAGQAGVAAPAGLAVSVTSGAMLGAGAAGGVGWLAIFMGTNKIQLGIAAVFVAVGVTGYIVQAETQDGLRREIAALHRQPAALAELRGENRRLAATAAEVEMLRRDDIEFRRLAQGVEDAKKAVEDNAKRARQKAAEEDVRLGIEKLNRDGNLLVDEYKALNDRTKDTSLTAGARAALWIEVGRKLEEIKAKKREIQELSARAGSGNAAAPTGGTLKLAAPVTGGADGKSAPPR